jgi:hypothetical protein
MPYAHCQSVDTVNILRSVPGRSGEFFRSSKTTEPDMPRRAASSSLPVCFTKTPSCRPSNNLVEQSSSLKRVHSWDVASNPTRLRDALIAHGCYASIGQHQGLQRQSASVFSANRQNKGVNVEQVQRASHSSAKFQLGAPYSEG